MAQAAESSNELLSDALAYGRLRYFRASRGAAKGKTGPEDTGKFADRLIILQECALLLGETLGMDAVSSACYHEGEETVGFCFDQNSNPHIPEVAGAMVNLRMPLSEFVGAIRTYINEDS